MCGKKYIAEYHFNNFMRMHHIPKEFEWVLEKKYRQLERAVIEKREDERKKFVIENSLAKLDALKEKNTLDFSKYLLEKFDKQNKYKKYKKKIEDK